MKFVNALQLFFLLAEREACGKRAKRGRVKGGSKVRDNTKYPSFVSIVTRNGAHYCGGVILDETTVLSAAHCQIEKGHKIAYGTIKRSDRIDSSIKYAGVRSVNNIGRMNSRGNSLWDQDYRLETVLYKAKLYPRQASSDSILLCALIQEQKLLFWAPSMNSQIISW